MIIRVLNSMCLDNFKVVVLKQHSVYIYEQIAIKNSYSPKQIYITILSLNQFTLQAEKIVTIFNSHLF